MKPAGTRLAACVAATTVCAGVATGQVVLNEILENPPGPDSAEDYWEYIELMGRPRMPLDGLAVLLMKGGEDRDENGVPEIRPEIDEVLHLDGCSLDGQGLLVIANTDAAGRSLLLERSRPGAHAAFRDLSRSDLPGRLANEGSSTYMLVRFGASSCDTCGRATRFPEKTLSHDEDFDGRIDDDVRRATTPFQVLDEIGWSHRGGREYLADPANELSETVGLNPDAVSRVRLFTDAAGPGHRTVDRVDDAGRVVGFTVARTTRADESFVFGTMDSGIFPRRLAYFDGYDVDGWSQLRGPTDTDALPVLLTGVDPEPDHDPFPPPPRYSPDGSLFIRDIPLTGFTLTPGAFNDAESVGLRQARFVAGDLTFDGVLDDADLEAADALLGASLDDRTETPGVCGCAATYVHTGFGAQRILAIKGLRSPGVVGGGDRVTAADLDALRSLIRVALASTAGCGRGAPSGTNGVNPGRRAGTRSAE